MTEKLLEIKNLNIDYTSSKLGIKKTIRAVDNFSLSIKKGEIFAIAGESGCGKSTLSKSIMKIVKPTSGEIIYNNKNILNLSKKELTEFRQKVQMIFQNPYASLNPKMTIYDILKEPLIINTKLKSNEIQDLINKIILQVGLCEEHLKRYPHEFSGGQRQRIAIARSIMLNPEFIIADEPVSALDASIQAQILNLIKELKENYQMTILFISHDLNVIKYLADRVGIMYLGELVEIGTKEEIFNNPIHPYTKLLLNSIPNINNQISKPTINEKSNEDYKNCCKFCSRCEERTNLCKDIKPNFVEITTTHKVLCNNYNS